MGPVVILEIEFPGNRFTGAIVSELRSLVERELIAIVDGVLVRKDADGTVTFTEFEQVGGDEDTAELAAAFGGEVDLLSADDVQELAAGLQPDSSAAVLVFEHTWAAPLKEAIVDAGGRLVANFRVPGAVVDEVLAAHAQA
jgi:Family of unknown function (DUF6325)